MSQTSHANVEQKAAKATSEGNNINLSKRLWKFVPIQAAESMQHS